MCVCVLRSFIEPYAYDITTAFLGSVSVVRKIEQHMSTCQPMQEAESIYGHTARINKPKFRTKKRDREKRQESCVFKSRVAWPAHLLGLIRPNLTCGFISCRRPGRRPRKPMMAGRDGCWMNNRRVLANAMQRAELSKASV